MKKLRTTDKTLVENVIKSGIIKEVISIQQRNAARSYAANRVDLEEFKSDGAYNNEDFAKSSIRGSEFGKSSYSPSKSTRNSPNKIVAEQPALPSALKKAKVGESESEDRTSPQRTTFKIEGEPVPTDAHGNPKNKYDAKTVEEMDEMIEEAEKQL